MRDIKPTGKLSDSFFGTDEKSPVLVTVKPGEDGGWVALRLQNLSAKPARQTVTFTGNPAAARSADPIEHPGAAIELKGKALTVEVQPREIRTVLVRFTSEG